ncbi:histidine kinase, partial [Candidatus Saccharibacteria bacterium]|nr:histidine kinase [Candidatus Saccharibacteria bacterium]NIW80345.1 histidine kinase [Calditrichia bacterium]
KTTVKLAAELEFIDAYAEIHKERLGEAFHLEIDVDESAEKKEVPPLALQLLVENAVKHNVAVKSEPLVITIKSLGDKL